MKQTTQKPVTVAILLSLYRNLQSGMCAAEAARAVGNTNSGSGIDIYRAALLLQDKAYRHIQAALQGAASWRKAHIAQLQSVGKALHHPTACV